MMEKRKEGGLRGVGYGTAKLTSRNDTSEVDFHVDHTTRDPRLNDPRLNDPRLNRKSNQPQQHQPQQHQQQSLATMSSVQPKRKQDIHLMVHQILSEHTYSKKCTEAIEKELENKEQGSQEGNNHLNALLPSFLSYVSICSDFVLTKPPSPQPCPQTEPPSSQLEPPSSPPLEPSAPNQAPNQEKDSLCFVQDKPESDNLVNEPKQDTPEGEPEGDPPEPVSSGRERVEALCADDVDYALLDGFVLDLDSDPSSCEEEEEDMEEEGHMEEEGLAFKNGRSHMMPNKVKERSRWSITNYDIRNNLIRLSKVDASSRTTAQLHNLLNGHTVPNKLAIYASKSSPGSNHTDSNHTDSPDVSPINIRQRGLVKNSGNLSSYLEEGDDESMEFYHDLHVFGGPQDHGGDEETEGNGCRLRRKRRRWESLKMSNKRASQTHLVSIYISGLYACTHAWP